MKCSTRVPAHFSGILWICASFRDDDFFRIELVLDAETAADIGRDHAQGAFRQAQDASAGRCERRAGFACSTRG